MKSSLGAKKIASSSRRKIEGTVMCLIGGDGKG